MQVTSCDSKSACLTSLISGQHLTTPDASADTKSIALLSCPDRANASHTHDTSHSPYQLLQHWVPLSV